MTTLTSRRLVIRRATEARRLALLDESVTPGADAEAWALHRKEGGDLVGIAYCRQDQVRNLVHILSVVIAPELRGWGFGSEAVELAEGQYLGGDFAARVDPKDGLNLYFWLRLGYRPANRESTVSSDSGDGMITMIRRHDQQ